VAVRCRNATRRRGSTVKMAAPLATRNLRLSCDSPSYFYRSTSVLMMRATDTQRTFSERRDRGSCECSSFNSGVIEHTNLRGCDAASPSDYPRSFETSVATDRDEGSLPSRPECVRFRNKIFSDCDVQYLGKDNNCLSKNIRQANSPSPDAGIATPSYCRQACYGFVLSCLLAMCQKSFLRRTARQVVVEGYGERKTDSICLPMSQDLLNRLLYEHNERRL